jgi:type VI secretion system protein
MFYKISSSLHGLAGRFKVLMIWGALMGISACSILAPSKVDPGLAVPKSFSPKWPGLVLSAAADVNVNSAVAVDIVFAGTVEVQTILQNLSAGKWFSSREGTMRTFSETLKVISLELVPGQTIMLNKSDYSKLMSTGVFVFANYATPGDHKSWIPLDDAGYVITLENRTFKVSSVLTSSKF